MAVERFTQHVLPRAVVQLETATLADIGRRALLHALHNDASNANDEWRLLHQHGKISRKRRIQRRHQIHLCHCGACPFSKPGELRALASHHFSHWSPLFRFRKN